MDPIQKQIVQQFAEEQPKNAFLWGSSGNGKSLLLCQFLSMKISHYRNMGMKLRVTVCSFGSPKNGMLMKKFKENYLVHLSTSEDIIFLDIEDLCQGTDED